MIRTETIDVLTRYNIRPSEQRIAVMKYLLAYRNHPSVDTIYEALHPTMPTLSRTTVYNVLHYFVDHGAVQMLTIDEKNARYDADVSVHAHFQCKICGRLYDLPQPRIEHPDSPRFVINDVQLYYRGICPKCNK